MTGYLVVATLAAAAVITCMVAWALRDDDYYHGRDIPPGWPLRAVKGVELRDALAADIATDKEVTE